MIFYIRLSWLKDWVIKQLRTNNELRIVIIYSIYSCFGKNIDFENNYLNTMFLKYFNNFICVTLTFLCIFDVFFYIKWAILSYNVSFSSKRILIVCHCTLHTTRHTSKAYDYNQITCDNPVMDVFDVLLCTLYWNT